MNKILYLCGFMGSGKTSVGREAAEISEADFIDLDDYIETLEGLTVSQIFAAYGEEYFRKAETSAIKEITERNRVHKLVTALGGGAAVNPVNLPLIRKSGILVYIDTDFESCYSRIKDDFKRPIAREKSKSELKTLYETRKKLYSENADFTIDGNTDIMTTAERILLLW